MLHFCVLTSAPEVVSPQPGDLKHNAEYVSPHPPREERAAPLTLHTQSPTLYPRPGCGRPYHLKHLNLHAYN